jgi:hypothetical protein
LSRSSFLDWGSTVPHESSDTKQSGHIK